jgi:hypothetical protein
MFQIRHHSRYAGETPADPPAAARSQLTCHALRAAEFEAELPRGGRFTWQPHGGHMAFHMANHVAFHVLSRVS